MEQFDSGTCCLTGYRPHRFAFTPDGLRPEQVQCVLGRQIRRLYDGGCRTFITGMCAGVDLWAADEVLTLSRSRGDVRLIAAIPFEGQAARWPLPLQREYRRILNGCAQRVVLFSPEQAEQDAAACYRQRNRWMVDRSSTVLAVYTPDATDIRSGTAATVRYARRQQRHIVYIHPTTLAVSEESVHQLRFPL